MNQSNNNEGRLSLYVGDKKSFVGDKKSYVGDQKSYVGDKTSYVGDKKSYVWDKKSYVGDSATSFFSRRGTRTLPYISVSSWVVLPSILLLHILILVVPWQLVYSVQTKLFCAADWTSASTLAMQTVPSAEVYRA